MKRVSPQYKQRPVILTHFSSITTFYAVMQHISSAKLCNITQPYFNIHSPAMLQGIYRIQP